MGTRRAWTIAGAAFGLTLLVASPALAHGDAHVAGTTVTISPDETVSFPVDIHFHRLAGEVAANGPVEVALRRHGRAYPALTFGPATDVQLNHLVRCCDDEPYAAHALTITNHGDEPVSARIGAKVVHDDLAVMVFGAESGTRESIVILAGLLAWRLWRVTRGRSAPTELRRSWIVGGATAAFIGALTLVGGLRYAGSGPANLVAALGDIPLLPFNPIVSRASLLLGVAIFGWGYAATAWARARPEAPRPAWAATGGALLLGPIVTAVAIAAAYGSATIPTAAAVAAGLPVLLTLVWGIRLAAPSPREEPVPT